MGLGKLLFFEDFPKMTVFGEMIKSLNHLDKGGISEELLTKWDQQCTNVLRDRIKSKFSSMSKKQLLKWCYVLN